MRFLNKFYSFIKSIYLNNSKYSNNLRHTLRIFFEREVKTKHTPTLFGSTFKGSKWVDYQTFNINKLFIKSGLSYFYYILLLIFTTLILLGRSKSEQYFGFLPFFSYINFILGYLPLLLSDVTSQLITFTYIIYTMVTKLTSSVLNHLFNTSVLSSFNRHYPVSGNTLMNKPFGVSAATSSVLCQPTNFALESGSNPLFSKLLSVSRKNTSFFTINPHTVLGEKPHGLYAQLSIYNSTFLLKDKSTLGISGTAFNSLTHNESLYMCSSEPLNTKVRSLQSSLKTIHAFTRQGLNYPLQFNFNLKTNLNVSNQQR